MFKLKFSVFFHANGFLWAAGSAYSATPAYGCLDERCGRQHFFFHFLLGNGSKWAAANTAAAAVARVCHQRRQITAEGSDFLGFQRSDQLVGKTAVVAAIAIEHENLPERSGCRPGGAQRPAARRVQESCWLLRAQVFYRFHQRSLYSRPEPSAGQFPKASRTG